MSVRRKQIQKLKNGDYIMIEDEPCVTKSTKRAQTGKHGHVRITIVGKGVFSYKSRTLTSLTGTLVDVPEIYKGTAQINFIETDSINIMDTVSFQQFDVGWPPDKELYEKIKDLSTNPSKLQDVKLEYWQIADKILITRVSDN